MPTTERTCYALIEYPEKVKRRESPFTALLVGPARISKHPGAARHQELADDSDGSSDERQIARSNAGQNGRQM